jgi:hypothetical protein
VPISDNAPQQIGSLFDHLVGGKELVTGLFRTRFIEPPDP